MIVDMKMNALIVVVLVNRLLQILIQVASGQLTLVAGGSQLIALLVSGC